VIAAADALFGQDAVFERRVAVTALQVHDAKPARQVAECDQVFAQRPHPERHLAELGFVADRLPEPAMVFAARRATPDFDQCQVGLAVEGPVIAAESQ